MLIERTIKIDGHHVTITHKVDTGSGETTNKTKANSDQEEFSIIDAAPETFTPPASRAPASAPAATGEAADSTGAKKALGGGEGIPADTGGGAGSSGLTIVFGPVTINYPMASARSSLGGGEGIPPDTGGGEGVPADTGGAVHED